MKKIIIAAALIAASVSASAQSYFDRYNEFNEKYNTRVYSNSVIDAAVFDHFGFAWNKFVPGEYPTDLRMGKSFSFSMDMASVDIALGNNAPVSLHAALRWTFENYVPNSQIQYVNVGNSIEALPILADYKKSKMRADYLGIPVGIKFESGHACIYANFVGEVLTRSITKLKTKSEKVKEEIKGFEPLRASVEAGVSFEDLGVFVRYSLTPSFKTSANLGNDRVLTIGIALDI